MLCVNQGNAQVQASLKSDQGSRPGTHDRPTNNQGRRGDPKAWAASEFAEIFPQASYRSQWYRIDRDRGVLVAFGIHGQFIYIHPQAELVIVRMASEATPLDADRVRGWRRGFDAIAKEFL